MLIRVELYKSASNNATSSCPMIRICSTLIVMANESVYNKFLTVSSISSASSPLFNKIRIIGIRPGEKIHEILVTEDEASHSQEFSDFFVIEPEHPFWAGAKHTKGGKKLPEGFRYTSENNNKWLTKDEILRTIKIEKV